RDRPDAQCFEGARQAQGAARLQARMGLARLRTRGQPVPAQPPRPAAGGATALNRGLGGHEPGGLRLLLGTRKHAGHAAAGTRETAGADLAGRLVLVGAATVAADAIGDEATVLGDRAVELEPVGFVEAGAQVRDEDAHLAFGGGAARTARA